MLTSVLPIAYQPKTFLVGTTSFDLKRTTVVCLGHRLSKHKMIKYARNLVGAVAPWPPLTAHVPCHLLTVMCWLLHPYIVVRFVCDDMCNCAIDRLCLNLEFSRHFPITFLEKLAESHDIHISITPSKCSKRSVHDTSPANGKYEHDQTLHFSKPFGTISSWFSFVVETGSSKRRGGGSAGTVNTTEMLLDAIKDLREEGTLNYLAKISTIFVIV